MAIDVLLVEDLKSVQGAMAQLLSSLGDFRVVAALSTEAEALAWLEQNRGRCQLAIVDLVLEQGSGMSVISRCRRTTPGAPVVVFSNYLSPGIREHCLRLGAEAAFDKQAELQAFSAWCAAFGHRAAGAAPSA